MEPEADHPSRLFFYPQVVTIPYLCGTHQVLSLSTIYGRECLIVIPQVVDFS